MHPSNLPKALALEPSRVQRSLIDRTLEWIEGPDYVKRPPDEARTALLKHVKKGANFKRWPMPTPKGIGMQLNGYLIHRLSDDQVSRIVANDICPNIKPAMLKRLTGVDGFRSYLIAKTNTTVLCPPGLFGEITQSDLSCPTPSEQFFNDFLDSLIEDDIFDAGPPHLKSISGNRKSTNAEEGQHQPLTQAGPYDATLMDMDFDFNDLPANTGVPQGASIEARDEAPPRNPKSAGAYMDPLRDRYFPKSAFSHPTARIYPNGDWFLEFCDFITTLDFKSCSKDGFPWMRGRGHISLDIRGRDRKAVACSFNGVTGLREIVVEITPDVLVDDSYCASLINDPDFARAAAAVEDNRHAIAYQIAVKLGVAAETSRQQIEAILAGPKISAQVEVARQYLEMVSGYESGVLTRTVDVDGKHSTVTVLSGRRVGIALTPYASGHYHVGWDNQVSHRQGPLLVANEALANRIIAKLVAEEPSVFELAEWRGFLSSTREALGETDDWRMRATRFLEAANKLKTWLAGRG